MINLPKIIEAFFYFIKFRLLLRLHKFENAINITINYIKIYPTDPFYHLRLAKIYAAQRRIDNAINEYKKVMNLRKPTVADYIELLSLLYDSNKYNEVIENSEQFLNYNFTGMEHYFKKVFVERIYWYLAFSHYFLRDYQKAREYFEKIRHIKKWEKEYSISKYIENCIKKEGKHNSHILPPTPDCF